MLFEIEMTILVDNIISVALEWRVGWYRQKKKGWGEKKKKAEGRKKKKRLKSLQKTKNVGGGGGVGV